MREPVERVGMSWTPTLKRGRNRVGSGESGRRSCKTEGIVAITEML